MESMKSMEIMKIMEIDLKTIHLKWQKEWDNAKIYEANICEDRKKKFITAAFPYPNSPQHIGHGRTYTIADVYARYWRMKGYNVLFPMAFHVTGTPIISMAKKIKEKDGELLDIFEKIYEITREKAATLTEPKDLVLYFSDEIERGMKEIGYCIDWRRKFYTFDAHFNKFIEWQFHKLKQLGYLKISTHPVPWCPIDNNAVSAHDTKGDIDPEIEEITAIKFAFQDGHILVSTYRPETLFGVTNLWINPHAVYVKAKHKNGKAKHNSDKNDKDEIFYLAEKAAKNLALQLELNIIEQFTGERLLSKLAQSPLGKNVPIFPASFVRPGEGTGAVMSVPAHAPYDYLALRDIEKIDEVGLIKIIKINGYDIPAKDVVERMNVKNQNDPLAEEATKEIYKKEVYEGKMLVGDKEYDGISVDKAREKIKIKLENENKSFSINIIAKAPVFCRCGAEVCVNLVKNQWFIDYGNKSWKQLAKQCLEKMTTLPERTHDDYFYTIDWLIQKACVRAQGLGTPFPFDKSQIIESLSDSTIYMAFYTIAHKLIHFPAEKLDNAFFDYIFLGKLGKECETLKIDEEIEELRKNFLYWYPLDSRHSGADLIRNHLTFFIFNHAAIFPEGLWPKQIVANGFVLMNGKKMSKSLGNILSLRRAIAEFGADVVRISIVGGADLSADTDFSEAVARGVEIRLKTILELIRYASRPAKEKIDFWLLSRLNKRLENIDGKFQRMEYRELVKELLYDTTADLAWYLKRVRGIKGIKSDGYEPRLKEFFEKWILAIAPLAPHVAEEAWHAIGNTGFAAITQLPNMDADAVNKSLELRELLIASTIEDIGKISELTGITPKKATIFVATDWKHKLYCIAREEKNFEKAVKKSMSDPTLRNNGENVIKFLKQIGKNIFALPEVLEPAEELDALASACEFMNGQLGFVIEVVSEDPEDRTIHLKHPKAKNAMPGKPAIVLE
ncbi:MAG: leucine--tRNA ligase [Candidatus Micrarchaeota archaeon]